MKINNLIQLMNQEGVDTSKLTVKFYSKHIRGMHATKDIKEGEIILFVPRRLIITLENVSETEFGKKMIEKEMTDGEFDKYMLGLYAL